jgi:hypothetical protein
MSCANFPLLRQPEVEGEDQHRKDLNYEAADAVPCLVIIFDDFVYLKHDVK